MKKPTDDYNWGDFLTVRASLIRQWAAEGRSFEDIAQSLSCDPMQARLISMSECFDHGLSERLVAHGWRECIEALRAAHDTHADHAADFLERLAKERGLL